MSEELQRGNRIHFVTPQTAVLTNSHVGPVFIIAPHGIKEEFRTGGVNSELIIQPEQELVVCAPNQLDDGNVLTWVMLKDELLVTRRRIILIQKLSSAEIQIVKQ